VGNDLSCGYLWLNYFGVYLGGEKSRGSTYPGLTLVMVDAHHLTPAEADEGDQRRERRTIGPYIKDTNFRLGGTEGVSMTGTKVTRSCRM